MKKIFITGGAGYIGSHVVKMLAERGHETLVYDNLSKGRRSAVLSGKVVEGDTNDTTKLISVLSDFRPDAVMHFAAFIEVGESVREPLRYYTNNSGNAMALLSAMERTGTGCFIFSSSAAVYGVPEHNPISENEPMRPINPYGRSKVYVEEVLRDQSNAGKVRYVALRYFNAAGADPSGLIGEQHVPESHLIPLALKAAKGERDNISILGNDYPTPDGTCIRDYIHVNDLAAAHIAALDHLGRNGTSDVFNCGYGHGYSVQEVIDVAKRVTGADFPVVHRARREGDPPMLVAQSDKIRRILQWQPRYDDLEYIIQTAWNWEKNRI